MRRYTLLLAAAAALVSPAAANAAQFLVTYESTTAIGSNNAFRPQLNARGLFSYATMGAKISLSVPRLVRFELFGAESGFRNSFRSTGPGGQLSFQETADVNRFPPAQPILMFTQQLSAGAVNWSFTNNQPAAALLVSNVGDDGFGIFAPVRTTASAGQFSGGQIWFSFDDRKTGSDNDHDDFLIRATAVPEPATWALMIGGFGLVGGAMRRRAKVEVAFA